VADLARDLHAYRVILGARWRAQTAYRGSLFADVLGTVGIGLVDLAEVYVIFHNVTVLGGLTFAQALVVFALATLAFSLADTVVGHLDTLPTFIRAGTVDAFYLRPLSLLGQLVTSDLSLRRVGRVGVALVVLVVAVRVNALPLTARTVVLTVGTVLTGAVIVAALFVAASALQFFLVEGSEVTSAFVYGGSYAAQQSAQVFPHPLRLLFSFVVPAAFVAYLPTVVLLDLPGAALLPAWLGWCAPAAGVAAWAVALVLWRAGTRHYQGAGG
jgi:ABC-2 type transport system permease protein